MHIRISKTNLNDLGENVLQMKTSTSAKNSY